MNILKSVVTVLLIIFCFSSVIVNAQNDALIHQYKFDGNLEDAVGDSHGVFLDGWWLEPIENNYITGHDGTEKGALNFDGAGGNGYVIYVGRWSAIKEGPDTSMTLTLWGLWYGRYDDGTQDNPARPTLHAIGQPRVKSLPSFTGFNHAGTLLSPKKNNLNNVKQSVRTAINRNFQTTPSIIITSPRWQVYYVNVTCIYSPAIW